MCPATKTVPVTLRAIGVFFSQWDSVCFWVWGQWQGKKICSSILVCIPLTITFLRDKQATALNCSHSLSELTFSLISQYILPYFEKILCEETVLMIQVIGENSLVKNSWGLGIFELFRNDKRQVLQEPCRSSTFTLTQPQSWKSAWWSELQK